MILKSSYLALSGACVKWCLLCLPVYTLLLLLTVYTCPFLLNTLKHDWSKCCQMLLEWRQHICFSLAGLQHWTALVFYNVLLACSLTSKGICYKAAFTQIKMVVVGTEWGGMFILHLCVMGDREYQLQYKGWNDQLFNHWFRIQYW